MLPSNSGQSPYKLVPRVTGTGKQKEDVRTRCPGQMSHEVLVQDANVACSVYDTLKVSFILCGYFLTCKMKGTVPSMSHPALGQKNSKVHSTFDIQ